MADRICSIEGCERKHCARGWCSTHWSRWSRTGSTDDPISPTGCLVDGCDAPHHARGWCYRHYARWWRTGSTDDPVPVVRVPVWVECAADGCGHQALARGFCATHYRRERLYGDPLGGRTNGTDDVGYAGAHGRVKRLHGPASDYSCIDCGGPATDWSYVGGCPRERTEVVGGCVLAYSPDPSLYVPRDRKCHKRFDLAG